MITTVCSVWVQGNVPYSVDYVTKLHRMAGRQLTNTLHRHICFTDQPFKVPAPIMPVQISRHIGMAGWWSKIELFNPAHAHRLSARCLYLDLDSLVVGPLDDVAAHPGQLAIVPDGGGFQGKGPLRVVKRYNSSVMAWTPCPELHRLHTNWNPVVAQRLWGDQDWLGEQYPGAVLMPAHWFPRISELDGVDPRPLLPLNPARVVLCKHPKNAEAAQQLPWVNEVWR